MMAAVLAVFVASLLGSVHCAAMCGGLVCAYAGGGAAARATRVSHAAYNGGRLISYVMLGLVAGTAGTGVDRLGALAGLTRAAGIAAGAVMVAWGATTIATALRRPPTAARPPAALQRVLGSILRRVAHRDPAWRAATLGLVTTLIPCGWLYAFVATAAGTGNATRGALVMLVFWAGTVPMMVTVAAGAQRLFGPFRRRLPLASAVVVVAVGVLTIAGRLTMAPAHGLAASATTHLRNHVGR